MAWHMHACIIRGSHADRNDCTTRIQPSFTHLHEHWEDVDGLQNPTAQDHDVDSFLRAVPREASDISNGRIL